jgi:hypothetical protein
MRSLSALGRGFAAYMRSPGRAMEGMLVLGEVRLWGRVFEHQLGWRAEWAYPVGLYRTWHPELDDQMQQLLRGYDIEPLAPPEPIFPDATALEPSIPFLRPTQWGDEPPGLPVPA